MLDEVVGDTGQVHSRPPVNRARPSDCVGVDGQEDSGGNIRALHARLLQQRHQTPGVPGRPVLPQLLRIDVVRLSQAPINSSQKVNEKRVQPPGGPIGGARVALNAGLQDDIQEMSESSPLGQGHRITAVEGVARAEERCLLVVAALPLDAYRLETLASKTWKPVVVLGRGQKAVAEVVVEGSSLPQDLWGLTADDVVDRVGVQLLVDRLERQQRPVN